MSRKINYKPLSEALEKMVKPEQQKDSRATVGSGKIVGEFYYLPVKDLVPFSNQARTDFDEQELQSLAESIRQHGIRQPLSVLPIEQEKYQVISGERRLRAAKIIGLDKVPCIIIKDNMNADAIALIENIHRKDLHPVELGVAYKNLLEKNIFSSQSKLADSISVSKSQISEYIKYAELDKEIKSLIIEKKILSRDKLRQILKAYDIGDTLRLRKLLGIGDKHIRSYSILRVTLDYGALKIQEEGIKKLSNIEKQELKIKLLKLVDKL